LRLSSGKEVVGKTMNDCASTGNLAGNKK